MISGGACRSRRFPLDRRGQLLEHGANRKHFDAIIIGAGFAGIYMLKKLQADLRLDVKVFERSEGTGGTWLSNRYPGALSDTEFFVYCYSWDLELLKAEPFNNRYVSQAT